MFSISREALNQVFWFQKSNSINAKWLFPATVRKQFVDVWKRKEKCHYNDQTLDQNRGQELEFKANQTSQTCQLLSLYAQFLLSFMSMLRAREYGYCQSLSVKRPLFHPGFYFVFNFITWMSKVVLLTESIWERKKEKATENGDPFYGQTLCHTWVAKPRYHCIV